MELKELRNKIRAVDIELLLTVAVESEAKNIILLNQKQLLKGETSKGTKITPSYASKPYSLRKYKQNKAPGLWVPDLFRTGKMFRNMDFVVGIPSDKEFSLVSYVPYFSELAGKYSNTFDLQKGNIEKIKKSVTGKLIDGYKKAVGL